MLKADLVNDARISIEFFHNNEKLGGCGLFINDNSFHIFDFVIQQELRNKGYGQLFMKDLIEYANERNKSLTLTVLRHNDIARRVYEKCGFKYTDYSDPMRFTMKLEK